MSKGECSLISFIGPSKILDRKNILSEFKATRIWPLSPQAMSIRIDFSEAFRAKILENQQKDEILEEELSIFESTTIIVRKKRRGAIGGKVPRRISISKGCKSKKRSH